MPDGDVLEQNKAIVRRMLDAFNSGDASIVAELLHPDIRDRGRPGIAADLEAEPVPRRVQTEVLRHQDVFPDVEFKEEWIVAEGDVVVLHWSMTGTQQGQLFGRDPTGRTVKSHGTEFVRIRDGKMIEHHDDGTHMLDVLRQLDMLDQDTVSRLQGGDPALGRGLRIAP
jgi:predicted ester cyclase